MKLEDLARTRLAAWVEGHRVTQAKLGEAAGHTQSWAQKYLDGTMQANLDELAAMAAVFLRPITALFDVLPDPEEQRLLNAYRTLPKASQGQMLEHVEHWAEAAREARPNRKRNLGS